VIRTSNKQLIAIALLAGLVLRAVTPLGYMPAAPGSGLLFELCPDQLPAGVEMQVSATSAHHHHHGNTDDGATDAEPDRCQIGHLLFSAVAADQTTTDIISTPLIAHRNEAPVHRISGRTTSIYQPRAPPHLGNS